MITKNKYAVQFYDSSIRIFEAENIESLCFTIAKYYGIEFASPDGLLRFGDYGYKYFDRPYR